MSDEQVERVAKIVYERGMRYLRLDVPEWTEGGNSLAQDEARAAACAAIAAMQPTPQDAAKVLLDEWDMHTEGLLGSLSCHSPDSYGVMDPDIDGDWVRFSDVEKSLRAIAGEARHD